MDGDSSIERVPNLVAFFRGELTQAFERTGLETTEETEAYLVHLLDSFARIDPTMSEVGFEKPAAILLEEAMASAGERRIEIYRRLGDASLYNCGFFQEHLTRRSMNPGYYRRLGQTAYRSLGDLMRFKHTGGVFGAIFDELAAKFDGVVEAFRVLYEPPPGAASSSDGGALALLDAGFFPIGTKRD